MITSKNGDALSYGRFNHYARTSLSCRTRQCSRERMVSRSKEWIWRKDVFRTMQRRKANYFEENFHPGVDRQQQTYSITVTHSRINITVVFKLTKKSMLFASCEKISATAH